MTASLAPPNYSLLPRSVINAELLLGSVVKCGPGVLGVGWPDSATARAATFKAFDPHDLVVVKESAAFVWGYEWRTSQMIEFSTLNAKRHLEPPPLNTVIHEYSIVDTETVSLAGVLVTTPLRTIYDLIYTSDEAFKTAAEHACIFLINKFSIQISDILAMLHSIRRPYRNRARRRVTQLFS
ncbi:MAG TPA: hypothetical protein VLZ31_02915 [Microbacteriaceae bacterium]|nr:hypothetical protein [Microbacteriaceae bacterium]